MFIYSYLTLHPHSLFVKKGFIPPDERAAYIELKKDYNPNDIQNRAELKKALMRRALKAIPMINSLQNEGQSIDRLYKKGMLTDDMHFKVKELKAFIEQEIQEVQAEAEELVEGWASQIWPQAMSFYNMVKTNKNPTEPDPEPEVHEVEEKIEKKVEKEKKSPAEKKLIQLKDKSPEEVAELMAKELLKEEEAERKKKSGTVQSSPSKGKK